MHAATWVTVAGESAVLTGIGTQVAQAVAAELSARQLPLYAFDSFEMNAVPGAYYYIDGIRLESFHNPRRLGRDAAKTSAEGMELRNRNMARIFTAATTADHGSLVLNGASHFVNDGREVSIRNLHEYLQYLCGIQHVFLFA
jgi:hypothetical protein